MGTTTWYKFSRGIAKSCKCKKTAASDRYIETGIRWTGKEKKLKIAKAIEREGGCPAVAPVAKRFKVAVYVASRIWKRWRDSRFARRSLRHRSRIAHDASVIGVTAAAKKHGLPWESVLAIVRKAKAAVGQTARSASGWLREKALAIVKDHVEAVETNADVRVRKGEYHQRLFAGEFARPEYGSGKFGTKWALTHLRGQAVVPEFVLRAFEIEEATKRGRRRRQRMGLAMKVRKSGITRRGINCAPLKPTNVIAWPTAVATEALAA